MRVGLDTSFLSRPPSGIGAYVAALLEWLPKVDKELEIVRLEPEVTSSAARLGERGARFAWETVGVGRAAAAAKVDLLHMPMMAAPISTRIPTVTTVHDVIPFVMPEYRSSRAQRINLAVARQTLRRTRLVIAPSKHAAEDIVAVLGVPREKVRVTNEAADPSYRLAEDHTAIRQVQERFGIDAPYVFNVGGLDVRKGIPMLLRAFSQVMDDLEPDLRLVIAGAAHSGNPVVYPPLKPLIAELGLGDRVVLTGRVSEAEKLALMQGALLYVTPSLYEGFGLTAIEAMACGIPVIASNRTSFPEVLGKAAVLVEPRPEPVGAAIRDLILSPERLEDLRERGLKHVGRYSWRKTARQTVAIYREALNR